MLCKVSQSSQLMKSQSLQVWQRPSTSMSLAWAFVPCTGARGRNLEITPGNVRVLRQVLQSQVLCGQRPRPQTLLFFGSQDAGIFEVPKQHLSFLIGFRNLGPGNHPRNHPLSTRKRSQEIVWNLGSFVVTFSHLCWGTSFRDFQVGSWGLHFDRIFFW